VGFLDQHHAARAEGGGDGAAQSQEAGAHHEQRGGGGQGQLEADAAGRQDAGVDDDGALAAQGGG
jgi:hypothetical protein